MKNRPYTGKGTFVHREPFMATGKDGKLPVEQLNVVYYKGHETIRDHNFSISNVFKASLPHANWRQNGAVAAPHLIPPSYKGWIWCEDVHENADPVGGNMGYCMGAHYGNQKNNLAGSFEEWGDAEALKNHNIKTWEVGGFTYKQDPLKYYKTPSGHVHESSSDPLGIVTAFKAASTHRPMTNALVLKNDEAGIDGVGIMCSNRPLDIAEAELKTVKDVTTNMCGEGKTVCSRENVTAVGTGIVADGAVVQSAMVIEQGLAGKCAIRELREEECQNFVGRVNRGKKEEEKTFSFSAISDSNKPKGCFVEGSTVHFNSEGHENPTGQKLCPVFVKRETLDKSVDSVFCCPRNQKKRKLSAAAVQTDTNVNNNLHYEFMCVDDTSAVHLCDPKDGSIVDFNGQKRIITKKVGAVGVNGLQETNFSNCKQMDRRCEYVPVDAYRFGMDSLKDVNLEAKVYFRESYEWGGNAGNNGTKKTTPYSARRTAASARSLPR